jgi:hypothetical protein
MGEYISAYLFTELHIPKDHQTEGWLASIRHYLPYATRYSVILLTVLMDS